MEGPGIGVRVTVLLTMPAVETSMENTIEARILEKEADMRIHGKEGLLENHHMAVTESMTETMEGKEANMIGHLVCPLSSMVLLSDIRGAQVHIRSYQCLGMLSWVIILIREKNSKATYFCNFYALV